MDKQKSKPIAHGTHGKRAEKGRKRINGEKSFAFG